MDQLKISCPKCPGHMRKRVHQELKGTRVFYGCSKFPSCRETMPLRTYELKMYAAIGERPSGYEA